MTKDEVLEAATVRGIPLTRSMFEQYVRHGLIVSSKDSEGYSKGVATRYDDRTLEAITEINKLKGTTKQSEMIFILAWQGYPVQWDKLKERMMEYQTAVMDSFSKLADYYTHPDFQYIVDDIAEDTIEKPKVNGRPSNAALKKHEDDVTAFAKRTLLISQMVKEMVGRKSISYDLFQRFSGYAGVHLLIDESIYKGINGWLKENKLLDGAHAADQDEYLQCMELLPLFKSYWDVLVNKCGEVKDIPLVGQAIESMNENFKIDNFFKSEEVIKYILHMMLRLLTVEVRSELIRQLSRQEVQMAWEHICTVISKGGESIWEMWGSLWEAEKPLPLQLG